VLFSFEAYFPTRVPQVTKGKQRIDFFTIPEYEQWLEDTPDAHKWDSKYYKVRDFSSEIHALTFSASLFRVSERAKIQTPAITSRT